MRNRTASRLTERPADSKSRFWDERFERDGYLFGKAPNDFLKSQAHLFAPGQSVLSIADGEGRNSVFLAGLGARVTALEYSPVALEKARLLADERGVSVDHVEQDVLDWRPEADQYDVVVAIFIQFAPPADRTVLFENMKRAVKPGGLLVMEGYRPEQIDNGTGGPPSAENMYTRKLLEGAFADFDIELLNDYDKVIEEGNGHAGISALIDLVARKPA